MHNVLNDCSSNVGNRHVGMGVQISCIQGTVGSHQGTPNHCGKHRCTHTHPVTNRHIPPISQRPYICGALRPQALFSLALRIHVSFNIATLVHSTITSGAMANVPITAPTVVKHGDTVGLAVVTWMIAILADCTLAHGFIHLVLLSFHFVNHALQLLSVISSVLGASVSNCFTYAYFIPVSLMCHTPIVIGSQNVNSSPFLTIWR